MSDKRTYFWLSIFATFFFFGWTFLMWPGPSADAAAAEKGIRSFLLDFTIYTAAIIIIWAHALFWGSTEKSSK